MYKIILYIRELEISVSAIISSIKHRFKDGVGYTSCKLQVFNQDLTFVEPGYDTGLRYDRGFYYSDIVSENNILFDYYHNNRYRI